MQIVAHTADFLVSEKPCNDISLLLDLLILLGMVILEFSSEQIHFCHDPAISSGTFSSKRSFFMQVSLNKNFLMTIMEAVMPRTLKTLLIFCFRSAKSYGFTSSLMVLR